MMEKLGRYDVVRVLGKGAMGMVYEARDPNLDRRVAIKTIKVENLPEAAIVEYEARFRTEARSAARLQHPNIVSVYDSERHGDTAYLVMEFVQGEDLKQHLDSGKRYTLEQSLAIMRDLLAALAYAHQQNIVHRDVKPANLMIEASGRVKLTDFGVARIQDSGEATRTKGSMVGTLKYMAPEQVQGLAIDARADLFAAGVVLYQLLTGERPFDGDSEYAIIHQIISQNPPPPSSINAQLPAALDIVVARALAKDRALRFPSAGEFARALLDASVQAQDATAVPPASASPGNGGSLGTGSGASGTRGSGATARMARSGEDTGSTVTQELELVYWKDIKHSEDALDLQGFLTRFPSGIYADLAR
ncbi:MAG: serine/threonine protein kinase, partial [Rhodoferax sp.]|nr:serine/threonine protein kinase [Rhodoferax sp.]